MIKIIKVVVPAIQEKVVEKEVCVCDICGNQGSTTKCIICGRDICNGTFSKCRKFDPEEIGDYPDKYCTICYSLKFDKYLKEREAIQEKSYDDLQAIDERIKLESLKL